MTKPMQTPTKRNYNLIAERERLAPHGISIGSNPVEAVSKLGDEVLRLRGELRIAKKQLGNRKRKPENPEIVSRGVKEVSRIATGDLSCFDS